MYWQFGGSGCGDNIAVITITLVTSIIATVG